MLMQYWVINANYLQHADCDPQHGWGHARNFTGRIINLLTFNGGYHLEHHNHPLVHWSQLPQLHQQYRDQVPAPLLQPSLLSTLWRSAMGRPLPQAAPIPVDHNDDKAVA